jgi:capsid protein
MQKSVTELLESIHALDDGYVDPLEPFTDCGSIPWRLVSTESSGGAQFSGLSEQTLGAIRDSSRLLALTNEFAINAFENRVNFIVGKGHRYHTVPIDAASEETAKRIQAIVDEFVEDNDWNGRQQEIVRRRDRDGEAFLRLFADHRGKTSVRFVEPDQVFTPKTQESDPSSSFGIHTRKDDVETVLGYWIDNQYVDTTDIQHRKANVDRNVKRGIPLLYPVRKNL